MTKPTIHRHVAQARQQARTRNYAKTGRPARAVAHVEQAPTPKPTEPSWIEQWAVFDEISNDWREDC